MLLLNTPDRKMDRLHALTLFEHAGKKALKHLAAAADEVHVRAGEVILPAGSLFHNVYVVIGGEAVVERDGDPVSIILPGEVIGEVALFCHCPTSGTIRAKTDLQALVVPLPRFWQIMHENPDLATAMAKQMAEQLLEVDPIHEGHHIDR